MTDALAAIENLGIEVRGADDIEIRGGGDYLPRLAWYSSKSKLCEAGQMETNNFGLTDDGDTVSIGKEIDAILIDVHMKALDMNPEPVVACYDTKSEAYKDIEARSDVKDSKCMEGPEFLVYIPAQDKFATLYFGNKSGRREAKTVIKYLRQPVTLIGKFIETKNYSWWVISMRECNTPPKQAPQPDDLKKAVEQFRNMETAKVAAPEKAKDDGRAR